MEPQPIKAPGQQKHIAATEQSSGGFSEFDQESSGSQIHAAANNSPQVLQQKANQDAADNSPQVKQLKAQQASVDTSPVMQQRRAERSPAAADNGLPDQLMAGIEALSGYDMRDVKVFYNSSKPAEYDAEAFAQGSEIHLAAGKEQHLPHEAWHVAQQKAGRVAPTESEEEENINTDPALEVEADRMGAKALEMQAAASTDGRKAAVMAGARQYKRAAGRTMQFGKRDQKAKARARKLKLKNNQDAITEHHDWLKESGRKYRDMVFQLRALFANPEGAKENPYLMLQRFRREFQADCLTFTKLQSDKGIVDMDAETCPVIMKNLAEALLAVKTPLQKELPTGMADKVQKFREDQDLTSAVEKTIIMKHEIEAMPTDTVADTKGNLMDKLHDASVFKGKEGIENEILRALLLSPSSAETMLRKELSGAKHLAITALYQDKDEKGVADDVVLEFNNFRASKFYKDRVKQYALLGAQATRTTVEKEYQDQGVDGKTLGIGGLFKKMATQVYTSVASKNVKKENEKEKDKIDKENKKIREEGEGEEKVFVPKVSGESDIVTAMNEHFETNGNGLAETLTNAFSAGSERFTNFFAEFPELLDQCLRKVENTGIHATLLDIKKGGKQHSIQNINDYVGDKLNEPLMRWVMDEGISVEVHAMSILASFAKLKSEGYTDVVEIPSAHAGTKKWIAVNPKTKKAKVVFQTLPGESYAIQTAGAFLFYEIYDVVPESEIEYDLDDLEDVELDGTQKEFTHAGYKARNIMEAVNKKATFILVSTDGKKFMKATVPYLTHVPTIGAKGEILLKDKVEEETVKVEEVNVRTLDEEKLSMFSENLDYKQIYIDTLKSHGLEHVDIACIGREGALSKALAGLGVKHKSSIDQIHFKGKIFILKGVKKGQKNEEVTGDHTLLTLSISPDFFGSKAGFLMEALKELGVKHISFVGTAGGLGKDSKVGDVMAPKELANFSDGETEGTKFTNKAQDLLKEAHGNDGLDKGKFKGNKLHYGVHSPITESQEMIDVMKQEGVESVDCEAGFIADALKGSGVDLYAFFFVGDVPGTHHSIGQGGTAEIEGGEVKETAQTERAVLAMIKKAIGKKIENSATAMKKLTYSIGRDGKITNVKEPGTRKSKSIEFKAEIPKSAADSRKAGILKNFSFKVNAVLEKEKGELTIQAINGINALTKEFFSLYGIKIVVTFP